MYAPAYRGFCPLLGLFFSTERPVSKPTTPQMHNQFASGATNLHGKEDHNICTESDSLTSSNVVTGWKLCYCNEASHPLSVSFKTDDHYCVRHVFQCTCLKIKGERLKSSPYWCEAHNYNASQCYCVPQSDGLTCPLS